MPDPIRLDPKSGPPYKLLGTEITKDKRDDAHHALHQIEARRAAIRDEQDRLEREAAALDAMEGFVIASVCQHCGGSGGFNVRSEFGWEDSVNICPRCEGTGRPKQQSKTNPSEKP